jgi:hypothetical protein
MITDPGLGGGVPRAGAMYCEFRVVCLPYSADTLPSTTTRRRHNGSEYTTESFRNA